MVKRSLKTIIKWFGIGVWELVKKKLSIIATGAVFILVTADIEHSIQGYRSLTADLSTMAANVLDGDERDVNANLFAGTITYSFMPPKKDNKTPYAYTENQIGPYKDELVNQQIGPFEKAIPTIDVLTEELPEVKTGDDVKPKPLPIAESLSATTIIQFNHYT